MVRGLLVALAGLVAPGFAQGLMRERKAQWIAFGAMAAAWVLLAWTVWAFLLVAAVFLGTAVDAAIRYRRLRGRIRWSWSDPLIGFGANVVLHAMLRVLAWEAFKAPSSSMNPTIEFGDHFMINKLAGAPSRGDILVFQQPCEPARDYVKRVIAVGGDTLEIRCTVVYVNGKPLARELLDDRCTYQDYDDRGDGGEWITRDCSRYRETVDGASYEIFHQRELPARTAEPSQDGDQGDFPIDSFPRNCSNAETVRGGATSQPPGSVVETSADPDKCKLQRHFVVPEGTVFVLGDNRFNSNDSRYWGVVPVENVRGRVTGIWLPASRFGGVR